MNQSPQTSGLSTLTFSGLFSLGGSILTPLQLGSHRLELQRTGHLDERMSHFSIRNGRPIRVGKHGYLVFGRGDYTFLNLMTSTLVGPPGGNAFASFLVGAPFQVLRDDFPPGMVELLSSRVGFYAQDDFKITLELTMNIGVRYDIMPYPREMHNRLSNFDPATGTMLIAGQNTSDRFRTTDYKDMAPRIGLAYAPGGYKTVIRAGYGIGFIDPLGSGSILNSNEFNIPFYYRNNITLFPFFAPTYRLSSQLPALVMPSPSAPTGDQRYLTPNDGNQYSQTWSLSIQQAQ